MILALFLGACAALDENTHTNNTKKETCIPDFTGKTNPCKVNFGYDNSFVSCGSNVLILCYFY